MDASQWLTRRVEDVASLSPLRGAKQRYQARPLPTTTGVYRKDQPGFVLDRDAAQLGQEFPDVPRQQAIEAFLRKLERGRAIRSHYELRRVFQELSDAQRKHEGRR